MQGHEREDVIELPLGTCSGDRKSPHHKIGFCPIDIRGCSVTTYSRTGLSGGSSVQNRKEIAMKKSCRMYRSIGEIACCMMISFGSAFAQLPPQSCAPAAASCNANVANTYTIIPISAAFTCPAGAPCDIANPPCAHPLTDCPPVGVSATWAHTSCQWCTNGLEPSYGVRLQRSVEWQLLIRTTCYGTCTDFNYRSDPAPGTGAYWFGCKVSPTPDDDPS